MTKNTQELEEVYPEVDKVYIIVEANMQSSLQKVLRIYDWKASISGCVDPTVAICLNLETNSETVQVINPKALNYTRFYKIRL